MLLTFEEVNFIKAGWKENQITFNTELRNLKAGDMTSVGIALANVFHLLNVNRQNHGVDCYGYGRYPVYLEPAVIIMITDGGSISSSSGVYKKLTFGLPPLVGHELTAQPFRWDQRLFGLVLRLPGSAPDLSQAGNTIVPSDHGPINDMCEETGGRSYSVINHKMLNQCLESLVAKVQLGVVLIFEKIGPDPLSVPDFPKPSPLNAVENGYLQDGENFKNNILGNDHSLSNEISLLINHNGSKFCDNSNSPASPVQINNEWRWTRRMIVVTRQQLKNKETLYWPIPESFWPDHNLHSLPPRNAHPVIKFRCEDSEPIILDQVPFDKYELEPSPLTQFILSRKQTSVCWPVYVSNSGKTLKADDCPFGYLKAASSLTTVNLFVMPYNYPKLLPLLKEAIQKPNKVSKEWKVAFDKYLKNLPCYYLTGITKVLKAINLAHFMPKIPYNQLSTNVVEYIKRCKVDARIEYDRLCSLVGVQRPKASLEPVKLIPRCPISLFTLLRESSLLPESSHLTEKEKLMELAQFQKDLEEHSNAYVSVNLTVNNTSSSNFHSSRANNYRNPHYSSLIDGFLSTRSSGMHLPPANNSIHLKSMFVNPFNIPRNRLVSQLQKMRLNLKQLMADSSHPSELPGGMPGEKLKVQDAESLHVIPVSCMGLYHEYTNRMPKPLNEIDPQPERAHAFGNPFKTNKRNMLNVDEAAEEIDLGAAAGVPSASVKSKKEATPVSQRRKRRRCGPLPKDFKFKKRRFNRITGMYEALDGGTLFSDDESDSSSIVSDDMSVSSVSDIDDDVLEVDEDEEVPFVHYAQDVDNAEVVEVKVEEPAEILIPTTCLPHLSSEQLTAVENELRRVIRIPGFSNLFVAIENSLEKVCENQLLDVIDYAIEEAIRFKRNNIIEYLNERRINLINNTSNVMVPTSLTNATDTVVSKIELWKRNSFEFTPTPNSDTDLIVID